MGCFALVLLGTIAPIGSTWAAPAFDIDGNTYTSPTFGYAITWDDPWFATDEGSENGLDYVYLMNGIVTASFIGFDLPLPPESCLPMLKDGLGANDGIGRT